MIMYPFSLGLSYIIVMIIHYFFDWGVVKKENISGEGIFGEFEGWTYCLEEEGIG